MSLYKKRIKNDTTCRTEDNLGREIYGKHTRGSLTIRKIT